MHVCAWSCLQRHMKIQSERCSWWMQYRYKATFGSFCISYLHTEQQIAVYTPSVEFCLWNGSRVARNHASSVYHWNWYLETVSFHAYSALQLAVEHSPEYTDWLKTKNTVCQIIQTCSGYHTVPYSVGIWVISWEQNSQSAKVTKSTI